MHSRQRGGLQKSEHIHLDVQGAVLALVVWQYNTNLSEVGSNTQEGRKSGAGESFQSERVGGPGLGRARLGAKAGVFVRFL